MRLVEAVLLAALLAGLVAGQGPKAPLPSGAVDDGPEEPGKGPGEQAEDDGSSPGNPSRGNQGQGREPPGAAGTTTTAGAATAAAAVAVTGGPCTARCNGGCPATSCLFHDDFSAGLGYWEKMTGDGSSYGLKGFGNDELQYYTEAAATVSGGVLSITPARVSRPSSATNGQSFTSARLRTARLADFNLSRSSTGLRVEARIKLPSPGQGVWPAFWMLPTAGVPPCTSGNAYLGCSNFCEGGGPAAGGQCNWPLGGELDVMEAVNDMANVFGTIHFGNPYQRQSDAIAWSDARLQRSGATWSAAYGVFALEWTPDKLVWYADNVAYQTATVWSTSGACTGSCPTPQTARAPFDSSQLFHLILNVAIGGGVTSTPSPSGVTRKLSPMLVDYVAVCELDPLVPGRKCV